MYFREDDKGFINITNEYDANGKNIRAKKPDTPKWVQAFLIRYSSLFHNSYIPNNNLIHIKCITGNN